MLANYYTEITGFFFLFVRGGGWGIKFKVSTTETGGTHYNYYKWVCGGAPECWSSSAGLAPHPVPGSLPKTTPRGNSGDETPGNWRPLT